MAHEIVMPRVDMDMTTGRMGAWRAPEGARVVKGETLFEIETDKAAMEVDAPASGVLSFVAASEGDVLPVGACIGWIVAEGEHFVPPAPLPAAAASPSAAHASGRTDAGQKDEAHPGAARGIRATPAARRAARERGLSLSAVRGSGPNGRIQKRDVPEPAASVDAVADRVSRAQRARLQAAPAQRARLEVNREWLRRSEGAPLVLIHGLCADLNGWRPLFRVLPGTRPALAIDLPGHGLSPLGEDASFEALVEAARAVLIEEGATRAHLVGHSLGGAVAAALSQAPGVEALSLMLIAPAGLGEETNSAFFDGYLQADDEKSLTPWLNLLVSDPASLGAAMAPATLRQRAERPVVAAQRRLVNALLANRRQAIDIRGCLAAPKAPVKVVFGLEDRITPAHHAEDLSPLVALHRFSKIGHLPHFEARREVARLIEELARAGSPDA
jgi:pyruvate dehydrogenase E2 component (dihydrolipoamide acetyltransferase)